MPKELRGVAPLVLGSCSWSWELEFMLVACAGKGPTTLGLLTSPAKCVTPTHLGSFPADVSGKCYELTAPTKYSKPAKPQRFRRHNIFILLEINVIKNVTQKMQL
jgi:hypothetical protein